MVAEIPERITDLAGVTGAIVLAIDPAFVFAQARQGCVIAGAIIIAWSWLVVGGVWNANINLLVAPITGGAIAVGTAGRQTFLMNG